MTTLDELKPDHQVTEGLLYRRIPDDAAHWVRAENGPTRFNFVPERVQDHWSAQLGNMTTPVQILSDYPRFGLLEIPAQAFVSRGLKVTYKPDEGPDHAAVWGLKNAPKSLLRELEAEILRAWAPVTQQLVYVRKVYVRK